MNINLMQDIYCITEVKVSGDSNMIRQTIQRISILVNANYSIFNTQYKTRKLIVFTE